MGEDQLITTTRMVQYPKLTYQRTMKTVFRVAIDTIDVRDK